MTATSHTTCTDIAAVQVHHADGITSAGLHGGFLQIYRNTVTLLTDWARMTEGGLAEAREAAANLRAEVEETDEA